MVVAIVMSLIVMCGTIPAYAGTWYLDDIGWWYLNDDGTYPAGEWLYDNGDWYLFDDAGYMMTGWVLDNGKWYYLKENGAMATGRVIEDGVMYILDGSGAWTGEKVDVGEQGNGKPAVPARPEEPEVFLWQLSLGSSGEDVMAIQWQLFILGYDPGPLDGYFGPATELAVKEFQRANGLYVDGIVEMITYNTLFSPFAAPNPEQDIDGSRKSITDENMADNTEAERSASSITLMSHQIMCGAMPSVCRHMVP